VGDGVFYDCDALQTLVIDGGVNSIGYDAFYSCGALKNLTFEPSSNSTDLTLANQTYTIIVKEDQGPFYDCPLENLNWNRNIYYSLEGEGGLDSEDEGLFSQKANLTNVTIGNQVQTIPPYTFAYSGVTSITIPGSVNSIGDNAFDECTSLTSLTFEGSTTNLRLGFQPGTNDRGPFYDSPLTYINLNRQIDYIYDNLDSEDEGVFANANTSTPATVVFGENVRAIHNWMFYGVPVSSLTIPAGIDAIGYEAFGNNSRLTTITCEGSTPATLDSTPFPTTKLAAIYVPSNAVDKYKTKWLQYKSYIHEMK
jgi:hypothetical protein